MSSQGSYSSEDGTNYPYERATQGRRVPSARGRRTSISLAVCGEPIVGRALVLLLQNSEYDVEFMPESSLEEVGLPEGSQLLLLTPGLSAGHREILSSLLEDRASEDETPVLELISAHGASQNEEEQNLSEHSVPWPCSTETLKRRIEAALFKDSRMENNRGG